eukprot:13729186-Alexandrium_andersonii.AAC.1
MAPEPPPAAPAGRLPPPAAALTTLWHMQTPRMHLQPDRTYPAPRCRQTPPWSRWRAARTIA